jgi:hypothetical protein
MPPTGRKRVSWRFLDALGVGEAADEQEKENCSDCGSVRQSHDRQVIKVR